MWCLLILGNLTEAFLSEVAFRNGQSEHRSDLCRSSCVTGACGPSCSFVAGVTGAFCLPVGCKPSCWSPRSHGWKQLPWDESSLKKIIWENTFLHLKFFFYFKLVKLFFFPFLFVLKDVFTYFKGTGPPTWVTGIQGLKPSPASQTHYQGAGSKAE